MVDSEVPEAVRAAARKAAEKHGDDLPRAVELAISSIRRMKTFGQFVDALVRSAIQDLVYDARHAANVSMRFAEGQYGRQGKVSPGGSAGVARAAQSVYLYFIAGRTLGSIKGDELAEIASGERSRASGHEFNARLCERLQPMVPERKMVKEAVTEAKLRKLFHDVHEKNEAA